MIGVIVSIVKVTKPLILLPTLSFTQFKIELDYLSMSGYSSVKTGTLSADFMKTFTEAEQVAGEKDWGSSLGDRYYSLNKEIEELSTSETKMKVVEYLQIEKGIKELEEDGYPVPSKINDLRNQLFKIVVTELESAIVNYEVPEMEEIIEEEKVVEEVEEEAVAEEEEEEEAEIVPYKEEEKEEAVEEPTGPKTYLVELVNGGFSSSSMEIKTGDTIKWNNVRTGQYKIALILGNRECRFVKSNIFKNGESYNATFTEPMECWISDGIFTTQAMKVIVS